MGREYNKEAFDAKYYFQNKKESVRSDFEQLKNFNVSEKTKKQLFQTLSEGYREEHKLPAHKEMVKQIKKDMHTIVSEEEKILGRKMTKEEFEKAKENFYKEQEGYDNIGSFYEGMARVKKGGKYGFMNENEEETIPLVYDTAEDFSDGLAVVGKETEDNMLYGAVDKNGRETISLSDKYDKIDDFVGGLAYVRKDHNKGIIDKTGKEIVSPSVGYCEIEDFYEGLAIVSVYKGLEIKSGFIDKTGEVKIPLEFDDAHPFSEGLAAIKKGEKRTYIDKMGKNAIEGEYEDANCHINGMARVKKGGKYGFINVTGEVKIPLEFDELSIFDKDGLAQAKIGDEKFYIDRNGKTVNGK